MYGATQRVGGYVNLVTKQPFFDAMHGEVNGTWGRSTPSVTRSTSAARSSRTCSPIRVSFEQEDDGSYYRNAYYQSHGLYAALAWKPNDRFRARSRTSSISSVPHYPDIAGINRPDTGAHRQRHLHPGHGRFAA